jgi:hypothetical protein
MRPCGTKLPLQFGQPVHAQKAYADIPLIDTLIYLQCLTLVPGLLRDRKAEPEESGAALSPRRSIPRLSDFIERVPDR